MLIHSNSNDSEQHEDNQKINWRSSNDNLQIFAELPTISLSDSLDFCFSFEVPIGNSVISIVCSSNLATSPLMIYFIGSTFTTVPLKFLYHGFISKGSSLRSIRLMLSTISRGLCLGTLLLKMEVLSSTPLTKTIGMIGTKHLGSIFRLPSYS
ncbi:hypothetical protein DERF_014949 [Dermatophagoides farinae]|uniref:Uncharacterized protein n=1 Tax=Dermatophagoides farinae TaxID=6954 RepID=A0A922HQ20_DERFA|nr:hypothetical protein DERF_014949 [Dermatophagoides farinae]